MITQDCVKRLFRYEDGILYRLTNISQCKIGDVAGHINKSLGYVMIRVNGKMCYLHHIIYLYHNGFIPKRIDHIDNNTLNNRIENLRECTQMQNCHNRIARINSSSKYKGVGFDRDLNKWRAYIRLKGRQVHLGVFESEKDAALAYNKSAKSHFKEFALLNHIE